MSTFYTLTNLFEESSITWDRQTIMSLIVVCVAISSELEQTSQHKRTGKASASLSADCTRRRIGRLRRG